MIKELDWSGVLFRFALFFLNMTLFAPLSSPPGGFRPLRSQVGDRLFQRFFFSAGFALIACVNSLWQFYDRLWSFRAIGVGWNVIPSSLR